MAFVIDAYAGRIVGWRVSRTAHASLVLDALEQALGGQDRELNRNPGSRRADGNRASGLARGAASGSGIENTSERSKSRVRHVA